MPTSVEKSLKEFVNKFQKELLSGITSLVLLHTLGQSHEPLYASQIAR